MTGPSWLSEAVFYEIYPQTFLDTNGDGIGDFPGITKKLDYIKELGCNALWLNPCFDSPFGDAGYDVRDYCRIAPRYGTNDDACRLFSEAHKRGMHVLFDLVPGHTALDHPWFLASQKPEANPYSNRYIWTDSIWNCPEVGSICGWLRGYAPRDASCALNFFYNQPALNYGFYEIKEPWQKPITDNDCVATRTAMEDVVKFWLALGCDGFRIDMASTLVKNDPEYKGTIALWNAFFQNVRKEYPEASFVAEWGDPYHSIAAGFDMDFLLHFGPSHYMDLFRDHPYFSGKEQGNVAEFVKAYQENQQKTNGRGLMCIPTGNHDMARISYRLDPTELWLAYAFILSMPGAPFIYYGDEIGMRYLPDIVSVEGGYNRTGSRTPMQWNRGKNAGFSSADADKLYTPLDPATDRPTVKAAMADKSSLWWRVHDLIALRKAHKALGVTGELSFLYAEERAYPFVYLRSAENEKILVALNPSGQEKTVSLAVGDGALLTHVGEGVASLKNGVLTIPARSAAYFLL